MINIRTQTIILVILMGISTCYLKRSIPVIPEPDIEPLEQRILSRFFIQKDTIGWRLIREIPGNKEGAGTVIYEPYSDSAAIVNILKATIRFKDEFIKAESYSRELSELNELLAKFTGGPSTLIPNSKEALAQTMPGKWAIINGKDSLRVDINTFLSVAGNGKTGNLEALDNKSILLKNILPADVQFTLINRNVLEGVFNNQKVRMIKL